MRRLFFFLLLVTGLAFAGEPVKICVAQPSGPEAKNWKLQAPIAKQIEQDGVSKQMDVSSPLLSSDDEKHAKKEAAEKSCSYILLTTLETAHDQVFGTLKPDPYAKSEGDINRSVNATPAGLKLKYKLITSGGKKVAASSVPMELKENPKAADFEEAGHKLIESVARHVISALPPAK